MTEHTDSEAAILLGDRMQSELSRIVEYLESPRIDGLEIPYEVQMSAIQAKFDIEEWTRLRRRYHGR